MFKVRKDPVSYNLAVQKVFRAPHWVPKMLHRIQ